MLLTKLNRPNITPDLLERTNLIEKLDKNCHVPLILASAPAGFGKSVLVNQWIEHNKSDYAWLSLDESMNDSKTFVSYLIEMLKRAGVEDKKKLKKIHEGIHLMTWEAIIAVIIDVVNKFQNLTRLILDDYHLITNQEIHLLIEVLIRENLNNVQVIIITRWDPPFELSKLRLYQKVFEIRMRDLRFDNYEITQLLSKNHSIEFSHDEIEELYVKTEGWILAIRMVLFAKSFHEVKGNKREKAMLTADVDRLMSLISENIDPNFFRQMQLCALCDQFNEDLVNAICEFAFPDSCKADAFLSKLKSLNFFLVPLFYHEEWYRFHHLISDILKRQLTKTEPEIIMSIYLFVSNWFADKGDIDMALRYAIKANNDELACNLITQHSGEILDRGHWWTVQNWLNIIPRQIRKANVDLLLTELLICEETWNLDDFSSILDMLKSMGVENSSDKNISLYLFHLGYFLMFVKQEPKKATELIERSIALYHDESFMFGARRELTLVCGKQMLGLTSLALKSLEYNLEKYESSSTMHIRSIHGKALIHLLSGNLESANNDSKKLLFLVRDTDLQLEKGWVFYFQGNVAFQSYNEYKVIKDLKEALAFEGVFNLRVYFDALAGLIIFNSLKGDKKAAELFLMQMSQMAAQLEDTKFQNYYHSVRARVNWHSGQGDKELSWAQNDWVRQAPSTYLFLMDVPDLTKIRIIVSYGSAFEVEQALRAIAEIETFLDSIHNGYQCIDIEIFKAMALFRLGDKKHAAESLEKALLRAERSNMKRPILEAYHVMPSLFSLARTSKILSPILAKFGLDTSAVKLPAPTGPAVGNLTPREQEVVKLISNGLRNKEVADQLHISTVTVKSHMTNVYRKLNVSNRTSMLRVIRGQSILAQKH